MKTERFTIFVFLIAASSSLSVKAQKPMPVIVDADKPLIENKSDF